MQNFPRFDESSYIKTRRQIHSIAKVIGKFRETLVSPIAKNDNLYLRIVDQGFCTPPMNDLGELELGFNLEKLIIEVANSSGKYESFALEEKSLSAIASELISVLNNFGINANIDSASFGSKEINPTGLVNTEFLAQFVNYSRLLSHFHKTINTGVKTQICLWPHSFDNAFNWFSGRKIDEQDEFMGIGVSNGDETYEMPYVYVTMYPLLRKTNTLQIAEGAVLHDLEWTGLVLPYDSVLEKKNFDEQKKLIESFFSESFASVQRAFSKR